jgi:hypothetical protein
MFVTLLLQGKKSSKVVSRAAGGAAKPHVHALSLAVCNMFVTLLLQGKKSSKVASRAAGGAAKPHVHALSLAVCNMFVTLLLQGKKSSKVASRAAGCNNCAKTAVANMQVLQGSDCYCAVPCCSSAGQEEQQGGQQGSRRGSQGKGIHRQCGATMRQASS